MSQEVLLVRGGALGPNTGIGGAHHTLAQSLASGDVNGWRLQGVAEYDLGSQPTGLRRLYSRWFRHPRTVKSLVEKGQSPNLIHITDQEQAHLVPKHSSVPAVVTVHDLFHLFPRMLHIDDTTVEVGESKPSMIRRRDLNKLKRGLGRADLLLCDSHATLKACKEHFPSVDSIWLPLGLEMARFAPLDAQNHVPSGPAANLEKACHLLIVGSHDPRKRMDFLLKVLGSMDAAIKQELHVHHVGGGVSPSGEPTTSDLAAHHQVAHFHAHGGDLSDAALMDLRHASEALLFPSVSEGFGYPPIEAMATGTPVLCADMPSHNELMPSGMCLPSSDVNAWKEAILVVHAAWKERTASDKEHVWPTPDEALIEHAKTFSIEVFNQRTAEAYNRLF